MISLTKKTRRVLLIVTAVIVVLAILVNVLTTSPLLYDMVCLVLGKGAPIYAEGTVSMYIPDTTSKTDAYKNACATNVEVCEEGFVLLKNNNDSLPLRKNSKVSVFGKNSVNLAYAGGGSGSFVVEPGSALYKRMQGLGIELDYKTLFDAFDGYFQYNPTLKAFYEDDNASGGKRSNTNVDLDSGDDKVFTVGETPASKYTQAVKDSYANYNDAAIVVITRIGGEGADLPRHQGNSAGAVSSDSHYLQLDQNEIDMLTHVCNSGFEKVIVLFNIPSAMEADFLFDTAKYPFANKIDAALWIGFTGKTGIEAIGPVLTGEVSPSGKTVDTWAKNFLNDPVNVNFGTGLTQQLVKSGSKKQTFDQYDEGLYYFVNYEEGIYVGYRYYETRGLTDGETWYNNNVVFPFGYGLSYTTFEWQVGQPSTTSITKDGKISIEVTVKNTGDVAGKDVVEIYASAPYTAGEIEKAHKVLVGFAKTEEIAPNRTDTVTIEIDPYDFASYDYRDQNDNGFYGYELDQGTYTFYVSTDSHHSVAQFTCTASSNIRFDEDPVTGNEVGNRYTKDGSVTATDLSNVDDTDKPLDVILSRSDWAGTWPTAITPADRVAGEDLLAQLKNVETNNPNDYYDEDLYEYVYFDEELGAVVKDLLPTETPEQNHHAFVDYDDERWAEIISACDASSLITLYNQGAYQTREVKIGDVILMPGTLQGDGPSGFTCFLNKEMISGTNQYCSEPVFASTWNTELIEKLGKAIGEEGLWGYDQTSQPYSSLYAPGVNIHRSQFGGRCSEYMSEDPFVTGKIAAAEIRGLQSRGVVPMVKHFAVNEQETHRSINGDCSWLTEQSLREIYLKGFEIAVKEGESRGLMTSFNRIGSMWTGGDYRLCTEILRDEWGFKGCVICDFNTCPEHMNGRQMAYAGGDLNLQTTGGGYFDADESDNGDAIILQQASKNIMYAFANSNAFNAEVLGYETPGWISTMIVVDIILGVLVLGVVALCIFAPKKEKASKK